MRVLRVAHHGVVDAWRERERQLRARGLHVELVSAARWDEGGRPVDLDPGDDVVHGVRTLGHHPNLFVYDPRPLWRLLGQGWDLLDLHEEPVSLAVAEIRLLRRLRRRSRRTPYLLYSAQNLDKRYPAPFHALERAALADAAGAYVCNREAGGILRRKGLRGPAELIPLGVDLDLFAPAERGAPEDTLTVGYAGRLEPHKGVATLLRAAALRPHWRVVLVGAGPQQAALTELAERLGVAGRVCFRGHATAAELAAAYRSFDVAVVPSLPTRGWLEQFCRVAVEAMAAGVPVVASASGAIPDVVGDAGVLVTPGDAMALAAGVDEAADPETWTTLRKRGLERSREFTWSAVAGQQAALYARVLGRSRPDHDPEVVVVAYGPPTLLDGMLDELGGGLPVTIVDNSSLPETAAVAATHGAAYLDAGGNVGFGAGVNVALRHLRRTGRGDRDVLLLNPDVRIDAAAARRVHAALYGGRRTAVAGATQVDPATGAATRVGWPFPTPGRAWLEALGLGRLSRRTDFAIGSVLALRADALADVGDFDEHFFLYSEETDWQRRAADRGWTVVVADVAASHVGAATSTDPVRRETHFHAGLERYLRKHHGRLGWLVYRAAAIVGAAGRGLVLRERGPAARFRARLYLRGPMRAERRWLVG